jgi:hypothetical protein
MAQTSGVAVQVNEGAPVPDAAKVIAMSNPGDDVRDLLGWEKSEVAAGVYAVPPNSAALYAIVAAAGRRNVVTLYGCNTLYCPNAERFPQTPAEIDAFARWACWVAGAAGIPSLHAVTIWNEMNGRFNGGIGKVEARHQAMANLLKVVVPAIRKCNPAIAIYAGAFVGGTSLASWFCGIQRDGFDWKAVDGLDVHPYLSGDPNAAAQNGIAWASSLTGKSSLATGCAGATSPIARPLYFSEWGGAALQDAIDKKYFADAAAYFDWFDRVVVSQYPVIGRDYFLLADFGQFPAEGLYSAGYAGVTAIGTAYQAAYVTEQATSTADFPELAGDSLPRQPPIGAIWPRGD